MKILRIVHGLSNNVVDMQVPDEFNIGLWGKEISADGCACTPQFWLNRQWIQHAYLLTTPEQAQALAPGVVQGMTKQ